MVQIFLNGGAMRGGPLHDKLCGAPLIARTNSAPRYRLYSVSDQFPAMDPVAEGETGRAVSGELYEVSLDVLHDSLLPCEPAELELGVIRLADGTACLAMVLRPALRGASHLSDISAIGSWRAYIANRASPGSTGRATEPVTGLRFAVNCSLLFTELPLLQRPAAARAAGFEAVEFWWPFDTPVPSDAEVDRFVAAISAAGVRLSGLNFAAGDMPAGDRGLLSSPADAAAFTDNIDITVGIAERTGCGALNALYGNRIDGVSAETADELAAGNLAAAATAADRIGAVVLLEALNAIESPRYPLVSSPDAVAVIDRVEKDFNVDNLRFLADFYHLARMGETPAEVLQRHGDRIGHVQIADTPGRHQPGTGDFDFAALFENLAAHGYRGLIGLEYKPTGDSADSFGWRDAFAAGTARGRHRGDDTDRGEETS